jgi:adenylate cyclase class 2
MQTEIEAKFIKIDPLVIKEKLKSLGANLIHEEKLMRRCVYETTAGKNNTWLRVRDEGDKITLAYKQTEADTLHGTKEISLEVNNFENTCSILDLIGLKIKAKQESKRERWQYEQVEITFDTWPWLPCFLEIEGPTETEVKDLALKLNLNWSEALFGGVASVYKKYFTVTDEEVNRQVLSFSTPCPWSNLY